MSIHIDDISLDKYLHNLTGNSEYNDLWCAWLSNDTGNDARYIWTLLNEKRSCNLPILLCPDDMDFWCTIIVANVSYSANAVTWNRIGVITGEIDVVKWRGSGIQNVASWSDTDWDKYGDTLSSLGVDDKVWQQWWSENWPDEEMRRIVNYFDPFLNDDKNIEWLKCPVLSFQVDDYSACVAAFRHYKY